MYKLTKNNICELRTATNKLYSLVANTRWLASHPSAASSRSRHTNLTDWGSTYDDPEVLNLGMGTEAFTRPERIRSALYRILSEDFEAVFQFVLDACLTLEYGPKQLQLVEPVKVQRFLRTAKNTVEQVRRLHLEQYYKIGSIHRNMISRMLAEVEWCCQEETIESGYFDRFDRDDWWRVCTVTQFFAVLAELYLELRWPGYLAPLDGCHPAISRLFFAARWYDIV